jgi:CubicO group peptidase (beta-lactamase class C family)
MYKLVRNHPFPLFDNDCKIEGLLKKLKGPSVSIGYIENGKLQQVRAFGEQKPDNPIAYNSIYKVASLTKPVTAMLTLKLTEAGKEIIRRNLEQNRKPGTCHSRFA